MKSEIVIRTEGMDILVKKLGIVDAERFIATIKRDNFDYTEWRRDLYKGMTVDDIYDDAVKYQRHISKQK
ncbi:hypothetical protein MBCUT_08240 [Methanobrevibacter cuticularis]|uniref:Uncharacterized protein n=1 Tax=Methanobrevibacter cuticularis TaxID=47311 RepID=A0A166EA66_9EURY|nr:hypothetical protein [Methanobrevibacter cuticularis]KZX16438.1 hypothetical protein MBCUT_08240 [Methanobrevibacter cuticularis]